MDPEDFVEPEVGVAVAVTAVVASPKVRKLLRQSAVYGVAAALAAGEAVKTAFQRAREQAQTTAAVAQEKLTQVGDEIASRRKKKAQGE